MPVGFYYDDALHTYVSLDSIIKNYSAANNMYIPLPEDSQFPYSDKPIKKSIIQEKPSRKFRKVV